MPGNTGETAMGSACTGGGTPGMADTSRCRICQTNIHYRILNDLL